MKKALPYIVLTGLISFSVFLAVAVVLLAVLRVDSFPSQQKTTSLADAIALLPHPEYALQGRKLTENIFWVNTSAAPYDEAWAGDESWIVNVRAGKATFLGDRTIGITSGDAEVVVNDAFLIVYWRGGWEWSSTMITDYISRSSGKLWYQTTVENGERMQFIDHDVNKTFEIRFAPENLCDSATPENLATKEFIEGILVNGQLYPFTEKIEVSCEFNEDARLASEYQVRYASVNTHKYPTKVSFGSSAFEITLPIHYLDQGIDVHVSR